MRTRGPGVVTVATCFWMLFLVALGCSEKPQLEALESGRLLIEEGQYRDAIAELSLAIELDPSLSAAYYDRGRAFARIEQWDRAVDDYTVVIRLGGMERLHAYQQRGLVRQRKGELAKAISDYGEALAIASQSQSVGFQRMQALLLTNRAEASYLAKDYQSAWEDVGRIRELGQKVKPELVRVLSEVSAPESSGEQ